MGAGDWLVAQQANLHGVLLDQLLLSLGGPNLGHAFVDRRFLGALLGRANLGHPPAYFLLVHLGPPIAGRPRALGCIQRRAQPAPARILPRSALALSWSPC